MSSTTGPPSLKASAVTASPTAPASSASRNTWRACWTRPKSTACPCPTRQTSFRAPSSMWSKPTASRPATSAPSPSAATAKWASNPLKAPVEVYIANFPWGKYVPGNEGADVCISSWSRLAPNTMPSLAKAGANYMNSQLIRMEAEVNGYSEGIALDVNGYLSEGSGENLFIVRGGVLYTTPLANSVLNGITRASVITLAKQLGIEVVEQALPREMLYICDEAFFTGTAAEVTHLRSVDRILVGDGTMGPRHQRSARRVLRHRQRPQTRPPQLANASQRQGSRSRRRIASNAIQPKWPSQLGRPFRLSQRPGDILCDDTGNLRFPDVL